MKLKVLVWLTLGRESSRCYSTISAHGVEVAPGALSSYVRCPALLAGQECGYVKAFPNIVLAFSVVVVKGKKIE